MPEMAALFPRVPPEQIEAARSAFSTLEIGRGTTIIEEGENDAALLLVIEGRVAIRTGDYEMATVGRGGVVGEIGMFGGSLRTATVVALEPSAFLVLDRADYVALAERGSPVAWAVEKSTLDQLGDRLRLVDERIVELSANAAEPRPVGAERDGREGPAHYDRVEALRKSSFFEDAALGVLDDLGARMQVRRFDPGDVLCEQGSRGNDLYVLASGNVQVEARAPDGRNEPLATLEAGDVFGMASVLQDRPRMASCVATEAVVALRMPRDAGRQLMAAESRAGSAFRVAMIRGLGDQLAYANAQFAMLTLSRRQRTSALLARLGVEAHGRHLHSAIR